MYCYNSQTVLCLFFSHTPSCGVDGNKLIVQRDSLIYAMGVKEAEKILKTFTFAEGESPTDFNCLVKKVRGTLYLSQLLTLDTHVLNFTIESNPIVNLLKHLTEICTA